MITPTKARAFAHYEGNGVPDSPRPIEIQDVSQLDTKILTEELFHSYQDHVYGGFTLTSNTDHGNIEFEAKVLRDMANLVNGDGGLSNITPDYTDFIYFATNNGAAIPKSFTTDQLVPASNTCCYKNDPGTDVKSILIN